MADYMVPDPHGGKDIPGYNRATPGFAGAILDLVKSLAQQFAPRSIMQRPQAINQAVDQASNPQGNSLGNQF